MPDDSDIPLVLPPTTLVPNGRTLSGRAPVVIMGPNGAGKTRFSVRLTGSPLSRIPALRNLSSIADIPFQPPRQALEQLSSQARETFNSVWALANDAQFALSTILSNNARSATEYADAARKNGGASTPPPDTQLTTLLRLWHLLLPGRELKFEDHQPIVVNTNAGTTATYRANMMSDGERVALYVAARVLLADPGILIVDEPELHLHSLLARRLWSLLEASRPDCRFVYITHDLPFALSRRDATFVVLRSLEDYQIADRGTELPDEVFRDIVGAATLTVATSKTVFCEGTSGKDDALYDALLGPEGFQVVAVGSCASVAQCVEALADSRIVRGGEAVGIIDRDFWFASHLTSLEAKKVVALAVHEVESLYVLEESFSAIAARVGAKDAILYSTVMTAMRGKASGFVVRVAAERAKQRLFSELSRHIDKVPLESAAEARAGLATVIAGRVSTLDAGQVFDEELAEVNAALSGSDAEFLAMFPAKAFVGAAADILGISKGRYVELLELLVREAPSGSPLRTALRAATRV